MTLRELVATRLFTDDTKIYFDRHEGCRAWTATFDHKVNFGNCLRTFVDMVLDKEIAFLTPALDAIIITFKEDY